MYKLNFVFKKSTAKLMISIDLKFSIFKDIDFKIFNF